MPANCVSPSAASGATSARLRAVINVTAIVLFAFLYVPSNLLAQASCCTVPGNVDCDPAGEVTLTDLTRLVNHLFVTFEPLCCPEAANANGDPDGKINITDLTRLINYLYITFIPPAPCAGAELTYAQREALFNAVDSAFASLSELPDDSVALQLAAFLNSRPEIDSAGVIDTISVWAWFVDGPMLVIPNNRQPDGGGVAAADWQNSPVDSSIPPDFVLPKRRFADWEAATESVNSTADPAADNLELPHSVQARVISTLNSPCFSQSVPIIRNLLQNNGYVTTTSTGSVPSLFNVQGDGVFYMDAHGGPGEDRAGNEFLAIWTATLYSRAADSTFRSLLTRHELVYFYALDKDPLVDTCAAQVRYAFTGKFVAQYMSFAPNSLVFINACMSDSVASMRLGFQAAGASVYCGWSRTVYVGPSNRAAEFLFDRLLGTNASILLPVESPPQRPFPVDMLWQDMQNRGLDTDPKSQAKFRVNHLNHNFGLLAPSIRYMFVLEHTDSLFITGFFGSNPGSKGRVIVGGTELPILDWQPDLITAFIPNTGAGSAGPVTVEVDGLVGPSYSVKRKSNAVNLTEWRGPITYTQQDAGSLVGTIELTVHLRADIHPFREIPHAAPTYYSVIFPVADDSYGTVNVTGQYSYTYDSDPPSTDTWTWSGSDVVKHIWDSYPNVFVLTGEVVAATHKLNLMIQAAAWSGLTETLVNSSAGHQYDLPVTLGTIVELYDSYPTIYVDMNNAWDILAGQRTAHTCCSHDPENPGDVDDITHTLAWPTIQSYFPPDTTAAQ